MTGLHHHASDPRVLATPCALSSVCHAITNTMMIYHISPISPPRTAQDERRTTQAPSKDGGHGTQPDVACTRPEHEGFRW